MLNIAYHVQNRVLSAIGQAKYQLFDKHFIHTIRVGLVLTTVLLCLVMAFLIGYKGLIGLAVIGGVAAISALVFAYAYTEYVVMALILTTTIIAPPIPRDVTTTLVLLLLLTLIWLSRLLLVERSFQSIRPAPPNRYVVLFGIIVVISFIWSQLYVDPHIAYLQNSKLMPRIVTAIVMILSPVAMLLFGNFLNTIHQIRWIIWFYIGYGAIAIIPKFLDFSVPMNFNLGGQLPVWVSIFAMGQVLFNERLLRWQRLVLLGIVGGWTYVQFFMGREWISGWAPLFLGLGIVVMLRSRAAFVVLVIIAVAYLIADQDVLARLIEEESTISGETRLEAGNLAIDIANGHFLFGTGPTGYYFYMAYILKDWFQLSHNNYVDIYAQLGIFGFITWIAMWVSIGWLIWQTYRRLPKNGFVGGLTVSLFACFWVTLVLMMLGDWVIPFTYTQTMRGLSYTVWPWLWAGLAIALMHLWRQNKLSADPSQST